MIDIFSCDKGYLYQTVIRILENSNLADAHQNELA